MKPEPERASVDLSVVVASYNTRDLLRECLNSVLQNAGALNLEVVVVDNKSTDGSPDLVAAEFPTIGLLRNDANVGFARANNRAIAATCGRFVLLLNPDTLVPEDTLEPMVRFLEEHPDVGIAGCRLERPDGHLDEACKRSFPTPVTALSRFLHLDKVFPKNRALGAYRRTFDDPKGSYEVDSVVGAFMLLRREVIERVGGLDEDFFMYGEDLDWCYRVKNQQYKVVYLGDRRVIHHKAAATRTEPQRMNWHFHRAMFLFHRKHLVDRYPFFVNWLVYAGITCRFAFRSLTMFTALKKRPQPVPVQASAMPAARGRTPTPKVARAEDEAGAGA